MTGAWFKYDALSIVVATLPLGKVFRNLFNTDMSPIQGLPSDICITRHNNLTMNRKQAIFCMAGAWFKYDALML